MLSIALGVTGLAAYTATYGLSSVLGFPGLLLGVPSLHAQGRVKVLTYVGLGFNALLSGVFLVLVVLYAL